VLWIVPRRTASDDKADNEFADDRTPRELRPSPYFMSWHPRLTNEPAQAWLREQVRVAARSVRGQVSESPS